MNHSDSPDEATVTPFAPEMGSAPQAADGAEKGEVDLSGQRADSIRFGDIVSGQFDADEELADLAPPKRVLAPMAETPKLHKVLAQSGMGSRLKWNS